MLSYTFYPAFLIVACEHLVIAYVCFASNMPCDDYSTPLFIVSFDGQATQPSMLAIYYKCLEIGFIKSCNEKQVSLCRSLMLISTVSIIHRLFLSNSTHWLISGSSSRQYLWGRGF
jgi:hypothetical protein